MTQALAPKLRVIGRYSILREIRRGRHSVSYAAVDPVMNRQLVVKAVELAPDSPRLGPDERRRIEQAFVRQAQAAGRLHHPHIVTVFDAGLSHAFGFLVIERVNAPTLAEIVARGQRLPAQQCASIGARLADALSCAHGNGVAHGHLGAQHVYVLPDGSPKVSGFGGWIDDGAGGDEALAGTSRLLPYFQNEITEETRLADLRALADLLFLMVAGRAPGAGETAALSRRESPTLLVRPDTPRALSRLLDTWLDPSWVRRAPLPTAAMVRDALTAFLWEERPSSAPPASLGIPLAPPPERLPLHTAHIAPSHPAATAAPDPAPEAGTVPGTGDAARPAPATGAQRELSAEALSILRELRKRALAWVHGHRLALGASGGFLGLALVTGSILAALHHPAAPPPVAAEDEQAGAGAPQDLALVSVGVLAQPWGEVIVDGRPTGVSPPLHQIQLSQGYHLVELRHGDDPPWVTRIEVRAGAPLVVEHSFP